VLDVKKDFIKIFESCLLPNGCLVAAPAQMPYYPSHAKSYFYSWPGRDVGFSLVAMLLCGKDYYEPVMKWIWERAEDFQTSSNADEIGLIFRSYHPNGLIREHEYQPDQAGTLLWALGYKHKLKGKLSELELKVMDHASKNLARIWNGSVFNSTTEDIWEERGLEPLEGNFTYSLASCITGFEMASKIVNNSELKKESDSMRDIIKKYCFECKDDLIPRYFGGELGIDDTIDASLLGLVWPFNIGFEEKYLLASTNAIESKLLTDLGVHRYPDDQYQGAVDHSHNYKNEKAGAWPLLTFWLSIAKAKFGDKAKAKKYFDLTFSQLSDKALIPEQLFTDSENGWVGVRPLLWSHAMSVLAEEHINGKILSTPPVYIQS